MTFAIEISCALAALVASYLLVGVLYYAVRHDSAIALWAVVTAMVFLSLLFMV